MENKKLLSEELKRFSEIVNYKNVIEESLATYGANMAKKGIQNALDNLISKTIKDSLDLIIKSYSKETLERFAKVGGLTDELVKRMKSKETTDKVIDNVRKQVGDTLGIKNYKLSGVDIADVRFSLNEKIPNMSKTFSDDILKKTKVDVPSVSGKPKEVPSSGMKTIDTDDFARIVRPKVSDDLAKVTKPGQTLTNKSFDDNLIDWSKVTNAKNMDEYNKIIAQALQTGDFSKISRAGFEKYGISDFRQFLKNGEPSLAVPSLGGWSFIVSKPAASIENNLRLITNVPDILKKGDWTPAVKKTTMNAAEELVRNNRRVVDDVIGLGKNIKDPITKKKWLDRLTDLGIFTIKDGKRKLTRKGWITSAAIFGVGSVLLAYVMGGDANDDDIDTTEITPEVIDTAKEIQKDVARKWSLLDTQYGKQLKTALGKDPNETFTDQDINDIYNKLIELNVIK